MTKLFTACEVIDVAVELERMGAEFYSQVALFAQDDERRKIFEGLAECERQHEQRFRELYQVLKQCAPDTPESYPGEWQSYVHALITSRTILGKEEVERIAKYGSAEEIAKLAIQLEKDSILLYETLLNYVPEGERSKVEQLLTDEREHLSCVLNLMHG
ncbi:MAG: ferritin family protein [Armatimonadota bacterium]|nr:ferritin family protein [Armatimonadota bacterium]MCX7777564.1 ferritin family protein [Armatimonadota bacterium]MDW8025573.1 ferritin family protein [Armatimonadota bacterium]